ncbi:head-tail adaptor protein [Sulfitobacter mediterraneus]|uniref:head-tail adaptor protein n=1 Tax=Sulfitobacter mediterraneus TaxID=83219 RepID=UPI0019397B6B|nr:head-tail adaptor protein [Sulfitobacter mediterraneus]MBM1556902.1 head-tail adaptor protein [Sulfitobacter mediterraneus]MBM1569087.1 head-tail adaptor protein [Sulfitobacter mediterraneus]MBM1572514.1 head-tail adaptor protein [Sulfitobacter mediterraneus]MBM1576677.1 head-tail adaptor protein [Sulfitobacter mediterraneus]MBM1579860.1 head-tail adaptor protein [Sulfitobacter mediterraneus]
MSMPVLSHALILEGPERISDGAGGYAEGWIALGTLWAQITARTGRETAQGGAPVSRVSHRIVVRGAPYGSPERPKPQQRLRDGDRVFVIQAVAEWDGAGRYLTCFADEEVVV